MELRCVCFDPVGGRHVYSQAFVTTLMPVHLLYPVQRGRQADKLTDKSTHPGPNCLSLIPSCGVGLGRYLGRSKKWEWAISGGIRFLLFFFYNNTLVALYTARHRSFLNDSKLTNPQVQVPYFVPSHTGSPRAFPCFSFFFLTPSLGSWSSIRYPSTLSTQKQVSLLFNLPVGSHPLRPWPGRPRRSASRRPGQH